MSWLIYKGRMVSNPEITDKWKLYKDVETTHGFNSRTYINEKDKQVVITLEGTQSNSDLSPLWLSKDGLSDLEIGLGVIPPQMREGYEQFKTVVADVMNNYVSDGYSISVAGHSLGGMIGPAYALRHPARVASLGLYSTAAFRTADDAAKVKGVVAAMRAKGIAPVLETLKERWFTPEFAARRPEVIERRMQQVIDTDPEVFLSVFDIYAGTEMAPWIGRVAPPSLVLTGENDGGCPPRLNRVIFP